MAKQERMTAADVKTVEVGTEKSTPQTDGNELNKAIREENPTSYPNQNEQIVVRDTKSTSVAGYTVGTLGTGFEDFTQDDLAVPFIGILQAKSPQVEEDSGKTLPGAKAGMFMNNVTNEIYSGKEGIVVVPIHRIRQFIEWIPKDDGGGLVNIYEPEADEVQAVLKAAGRKVFGKLPIGDGNELAETYSVFALQLLPGGFTRRVVLSFASSQIGQYKKWMTMAREIQVINDEALGPQTPPLWSHKYRLTTFYHQKKNQSWYKWNPSFDGGSAESARLADTDPICEQAKQFREMVMAGRVEANYKNLEQEGEVEGEDFQM